MVVCIHVLKFVRSLQPVNHVSLATLDKYRLKSGYVSVMLNILCVRVCQLNCELRVVINIFN